MGWRFRKIFRSGPFRWSLSKKGVGYSWGLPWLRYGISPTGQRYISFSIPRTGIYYIKYLDKPNMTNVSNKPQGPQNTSSANQNLPWWKNP